MRVPSLSSEVDYKESSQAHILLIPLDAATRDSHASGLLWDAVHLSLSGLGEKVLARFLLVGVSDTVSFSPISCETERAFLHHVPQSSAWNTKMLLEGRVHDRL